MKEEGSSRRMKEEAKMNLCPFIVHQILAHFVELAARRMSMLCRNLLDALSSTKPTAEAAADVARPPPSKALAHALHAPAEIRCAAERSAAVGGRCDLPSSQSCPRYSETAASIAAATLCPHGMTYSLHTLPNQATPHRPRSGQRHLHHRTSGRETLQRPEQTSQHLSSRKQRNA